MSTETADPGPADAPGIAVCHLELAQGCLDAERVLGLLRTRGYIVDRLVFRGRDCHIWVRARADEVPLLHSRLQRLVGVEVGSDLEWRHAAGVTQAQAPLGRRLA